MSIATYVACLLIASATAELSGKVVDEDGNSIEHAIVVIRTARPKVGPSTTCPSCYRDCTKRTRTDGRGGFAIEHLSDSLEFTLAAGASGYQGTSSEFFDPADGPEIELTLKALPDPRKIGRIRGTVVNQDGQPISGAELRVRTLRQTNGRIGGTDKSVTSLTLTNEAGEFEISAGSNIQGFDLRVVASGYAPNETHWSRSIDHPLRIELGRGASLKGRLVYQGRPVSSVEVGLVQKNRMIGNIVTPQEVHTDKAGEFHFERLPPGLEYTLYTHTGQAAPAVLPVNLVEAPAHGECAEFGDIELSEPSKLAITVVTEDGSKLPKDSYVMITRRDAWRGAKRVLAEQQSFTANFNDVPKEMFGIILRVPGYKVTNTIPATNLDMNRRYNIAVSGDTSVRFTVSAKTDADAPRPSKTL